MSRNKNKSRKSTPEEIEFWEEVVNRTMSNSAYWSDFLYWRKTFDEAVKSRSLSISKEKEAAEILRGMAN